MGSGELQCLAERERETEAVDQAESEGNHPPAVRTGSDDVLERHVNDRDGDQGFDQRRKPERIGRDSVGRRDQRDGVGHGERGDHQKQRPQAPQRDHEAEQKQQMVGAVENVEEAQLDEAAARPGASVDRAAPCPDRR